MKVKTSNLIGPALDWAVAKCEGVNEEAFRLFYEPTEPTDYDKHGFPEFHYSTIWHKAGPIIERERIKISPTIHGTTWTAQFRHVESHPLVPHPALAGWTNKHGPTALIAAMRCFVASRLGDEVDVPEELL